MYKKIYRNMCFISMATLVLAIVLIISACYSYFDNRFKTEISAEAAISAAFINSGENPVEILQKTDTGDRRFTLIDKDGTVLYDSASDNPDNHASRPEVIKAMKDGIGIAERYSATESKKLYYYALRLDNGSILRIAANPEIMPSMFYSILISVLFISALIYLLSAIVSMCLTENIVKPIKKIDPFDEESFESVYEEIQPFLKRIAKQNAEISRQIDKVKEQKARLQAIMDNINEGLIIIDTNCDVLTINNPALRILRAEVKYVQFKGFRQLTDSESVLSAADKALRGEKNNIIYEAGNRTYQIFCSPVTENGIISGAVLLLFDVTERTESEKIRREFTANVSHELKTPLTTIHGYAQIIDSGIAKPDDIIGFVKKIEKESSRLMALVNDIIELSHLDENKGDTPKQNISLMPLVTEVTDTLAPKADERNVTISVTGEDTTIYANLPQITEMVYNLIDNAIKYNKPSGSVTVKISPKKLEISDTGIGIPEKYFERIFERFFRVDKSHSKTVNGTGLGLSIVKHIAKVNDAELKVKSTPGKGSTFTVIFK